MSTTTLAFASSSIGAGTVALTLPIDATGWTGSAELFAWAGFSADFDRVVTAALGASPSISSIGYRTEVDVNSFLNSCEVSDAGTDRTAHLGEKSSFRKAWAAAHLLSSQVLPTPSS